MSGWSVQVWWGQELSVPRDEFGLPRHRHGPHLLLDRQRGEDREKGYTAMSKSRSEIDFAVEFGRYLADAAEQFMAEQNRAAFVGEDPDPDYWRSLASAIYEFRKRADRADAVTNLFRRLGANQRRRSI